MKIFLYLRGDKANFRMAQKKTVEKNTVEKKDQWVLKNLIGAVVFVVALLILASVGLRVITRHGKTVTAPDFTNLSIQEAENLAAQGQVSVKVVDSVFVRRLPGGVVYRQQPKAGSTVKKGRSIFLTINSVVPRKVVMPNLYGYSITEARTELKNRGLSLGNLRYVRDIATNTVLGQFCEGKSVKAGDLVVSGSAIDLKVGVNKDDDATLVPHVIGMKYVPAVDALHDHYLNTGRIRFDADVRTYADSVNAIVYKQEAEGEEMPLGSTVNIYLTLDPQKVPAK